MAIARVRRRRVIAWRRSVINGRRRVAGRGLENDDFSMAARGRIRPGVIAIISIWPVLIAIIMMGPGLMAITVMWPRLMAITVMRPGLISITVIRPGLMAITLMRVCAGRRA
jgi:hypothetical protein